MPPRKLRLMGAMNTMRLLGNKGAPEHEPECRPVGCRGFTSPGRVGSYTADRPGRCSAGGGLNQYRRAAGPAVRRRDVNSLSAEKVRPAVTNRCQLPPGPRPEQRLDFFGYINQR